MLSSGSPQRTVGDTLRPASLPTAKRMISGLAGAAEQFSMHMATSLAVNEALKPVELAIESEKSVFDAAITLARHKIKIAEFRQQHGLDQEFLDQARRDLDEGIQSRVGETQTPRPVVGLPVIVRPEPHRDPSIDSAIQRRFDGAMAARSEYFAEIAHQLGSDDRLPPLIRPSLQEFDHEHFWDLLVSQMADAISGPS